jgi:hypothetical protein
MPVYEPGSFTGRGVLDGVLPPARQGPSQRRGWRDVAGVRRAPDGAPAGRGGPAEGRAERAPGQRAVVGPEGQAIGPSPTLRGEREHAGHRPIHSCTRRLATAEVAEVNRHRRRRHESAGPAHAWHIRSDRVSCTTIHRFVAFLRAFVCHELRRQGSRKSLRQSSAAAEGRVVR